MTRALTLSLAVSISLAACGGGTGGGTDGTVPTDVQDTSTGGDGVTVTPGPRVEPAWQVLYGADENGATYDQEGLKGIGVAGDGTILALADRRYDDDPYGPRLLLTRIDPDGTALGVRTLGFGRNTEVQAFGVRPSGDMVLAIEDGTVVELDTDGQVAWSVELNRDPYAFGGLDVASMALDDAGRVYLAGRFNPSEDSGERGFLIALTTTGEVAWMRSWRHAAFVEDQQVTVGPAGVFVSDQLAGSQEVNRRFAVFAFDHDGQRLAAKDFALPGSSEPAFPAISRGTVIADAAGVTVIGARSTAVDEDFAVLVYRLALDATLTPTAQGGTRVPADINLFARTVVATRGADGAVRAALRLEAGYLLLRYPDGALAAEAYDLVRDDGGAPVVVDEDLPLWVTAGANGATYFGATATSTGTLAITPRASVAVGLPLALEDLGDEIFEDTLTADAVTIEVTVAEDSAGETGAARDGDEDLLLFRAPF